MRFNKWFINNKLLLTFIIFIILPLIVWAVITQRFNVDKKATDNSSLVPFMGLETAPFKILFININNTPHFDAIVDGVINNKFKTISPYKENINFISFYKININLITPDEFCKPSVIVGSSGFGCDPDKIFGLIGQVYSNFNNSNFTNIAFIENVGGGGSADSLITIGINPTLDEVSVVDSSNNVIIHEVSHQFGLLDYANGWIKYDGSPNMLWEPSYMKKFYNLDYFGCSKWCQSYKPVSEYNQSVSSACIQFSNQSSCLAFNRSAPGSSNEHCIGENCCVWSDTPFEYFNSKCAPWKGTENIGLQCLPNTGCYFGGSYSHYIWRPVLPESTTIMLGGDGVFDKVSEKHIESVFRCCIGSTYKSSLTENLNCQTFKTEYEIFLNSNMVSQIGLCHAKTSPIITPTPSPIPIAGDINGDGHTNIIDIGIIIDNYGKPTTQNPSADLNNDGVINIVDIGIVIDNYQF